jgi:YfiH family protein
MLKRNEKNGVVYYTSELLAENGVRHAFFARYGGESLGAFESLNVSFARKDENGNTDSAQNVKRNFKIALGTLGIKPQNAVMAHQVHSDAVIEVTKDDADKGINLEELPECDGLVLKKETENVDAVCVKTADCVPIILADKRSGAVSAVHAGWKGTALGIVSKALQILSPADAKDVICAIGPCIGLCCYETGKAFGDNFSEIFAKKGITGDEIRERSLFSFEYGKMHTDLAAINGLLLEKCGILPENVDYGGICTCCYTKNGEREFFSHRGQGGFSGTFLTVAAK